MIKCRPTQPAIALLILAALASALQGCKRSDSAPEIISLTGRIERLVIDVEDRGSLSVLYYSEKHKEETIGTGIVTPETEIMINGATAKLKDLREGDRVRGDVRVEGKGQQRRLIAIKIYVERPLPTGG